MYQGIELEKVFTINTIFSAFGKKYDSNYYFEGESHDFWETVFVVDGEIGVTAGSELFVLKKGQAIIHEPMEFHRLWSEGNTCPELVIFSFAAKNVPEYSSKIFEIEDISAPGKILEEIRKNFDAEDFALKNIKNSMGYQLSVKKLEMFLIENVSQKLTGEQTIKSKAAENYAAIVNVLENNIDKNLVISDVARMCRMSEINVKKTFSKYSGMGIMAYFNHLKINSALTMIKSGRTVAETAAALGFSNQNYFSTVFKRIMGHPPTYYR